MLWVTVLGTIVAVAVVYLALKLRGKFSRTENLMPGSQEEGRSVPDIAAAIGEPVLLQNSWKEPPFAITVLGLPEVVNRSVIRVPVRITAIIPRWAYDESGGILASLTDVRWQDGEGREWYTRIYDPAPPLLPEGGDPFEGIVLAQGGSHDGFLYFREEDNSASNAYNQDFVELHYLDGSEQVIIVDHSRSVTLAERVEFSDGVAAGNLDFPEIMAKLKKSGSQWEDAGDPTAPAGIGDAIPLADATGKKPWLDLTVLGPPEPFGENMARLPLRVTGQASGGQQYQYLSLQLGTAPDRYGRIHHIWEVAHGAGLEDSLDGITLRRGQTRDGHVYFRPGNTAARWPDVPFTTLWYGPYLLELPVDVQSPTQ